jgi:GT2 family glycosyltransferase
VAVLQRERPDVELLETGENLGFAGGNEAGIRYAFAHLDFGWILLVNSDVVLDRGFLPPLIEAALDPSVGAAGPRINYFEPRDRIWAAGGRLRVRETVTAEHGQGCRDGPRFSVARDVTYLTTCCLLVPRDALERVGLFDPLFFIGVEDADWCQRALDAGYRLRYVPESRIWHKVAVSTGGSYTPFKTFHTGRSNTLFARRHFGPFRLAAYLLANLGALLWAFLRELPRGNSKAVIAKAKGVWRGLGDRLPPPPRVDPG